MTESGVVRALGKRDGREAYLPKPAINLAQRLAQLSRREELVIAEVVIAGGSWYLRIDGRNEKLGK